MRRAWNTRLKVFLPAALAVLMAASSCNNPFSTREAQKPDEISGVAIKPANSPENVLYNLKASFESMSIQDYLDVFTDDFVFNPDPDDSVLFVEDFRDGWGIEKERTYAENFLQRKVTAELEFFTHMYEYKAGDDKYDYRYSIKVTIAADSTGTVATPEEMDGIVGNTSGIGERAYYVKGHAWLYLREDEEGKWKIYKWVELANMIEGAFITWGVLRRSNI